MIGLPIPSAPDDVTPKWLSAALGTVVSDVRIESVGTGQTGATYRIAVTYGEPSSLPSTFVVKLSSQDGAVRERVAPGYKVEYGFYLTVASGLRLPLPTCHYSDVSADGADIVLLLSDLAPARQGDQLAGCSSDEAKLAVDALAGLHGPSWCDPAWLTFTGVAFPKPNRELAQGIGALARMAAEKTDDLLGQRMLAEDRTTLAQAADLIEPWLLLEPERFSLLHADYRLDNLLFRPDVPEVTVVDWQTLSVGLPARDLSYFLATSLLPDQRETEQHALVQRYHAALLGHGVVDYDHGTCWRDYRLGMLQVPLLTTLGFAFALATERGDDMMLTMLARGCRAIRELDTLDEIRRSA